MQAKMFSGLGVALVTPMKSGKVDFPALEKITELVINGGVDYLVVLGTTGESVTLDAKECRAIFDCVLAVNSGRKKMVAGYFGENDTRVAIERINAFDFNGFDGILSSSPAYSKPSQEGIYQHYKHIADASKVPVILYNVPGRTSSNVLPETTLRLANHPNICATKEAKGDIVQASHIIKNAPDNFTVLSGDDPTAIGLMACGGDGLISVIGNALPKTTADMIHAAQAGDFKLASELHLAMLNFHNPLYADGNPCGIKGLLNILGLCEIEVRLPLVPLQATTKEKLKSVWQTFEAKKKSRLMVG